ncbi:single-stranded-DNA-specific exonuclease RecJ [Temperatibacter marinus]|uniref:Single-stranded-DNA-specific exonuclease RecJ n=1 Tax=Temperatibacter marinus TaxID=1456591 RepID=A0AA52EFL2_9PROT|nr:single-stranded-DNA-specific exonuclease RecJ [Temperatibacter marinus]WND01930.1 single-stranded-DNA-specific exonuclease RecJ [Temperatibacter marinus]
MTHDTIKNSDDTADTLLGVRRSSLGQRWSLKPFISRHAEAIADLLGVSPIVGQIIAARNIDIEHAAEFYEPSLRNSLPDPNEFLDMDKAVDRLCQALEREEKVAVFGDYDVDGATSSALLIRYFRMINRQMMVHIPDRNLEGYGPNTAALTRLHSKGAKVVITVDCGTLSFQPLEDAFNLGLDIVVVDHHKAETTLPKAVAVVNPNRLDESGHYGQLAAAGVTFMLLVALNKGLRERGWFSSQQIKEPNLLSLLDIVALGTVCDVVPLTGVNRAFVKQGLKIMAQRQNAGIVALSDVGRVDEAPNAYHLGFVLGPRVNAGGRVGEAGLGARLLALDDYQAARQIADKLDGYNQDRKVIEAHVLDEAFSMMTKKYGPDGGPETLVFVAAKGWHAGVIGIVASRLKEKYNKPAFVLAIEENGEAKGSGRSITGVDLGAAVLEAQAKEILVKGGGHAMAAGLTVMEDRLDDLEHFLGAHMAEAVSKASETRTLEIDTVTTFMACQPQMIEDIEKVGPFGVGNPGPKLAFSHVTLTKVDVVGQNHMRAIFTSKDGSSMKAMAFRSLGEPLGNSLEGGIGKKFHIVGKVKVNTWGGRESVEMTLEDLASC